MFTPTAGNKSHRLTRTGVAVTIALSALSLLSCASAGSATRPDQITAGDAIGEAFECTPEKIDGDSNPLAVDWSDGQRAALESAMARGVAVVAYTCEGIEVLKACSVAGDYAYNGVSKKTKAVQIKDLGSVQANFSALSSSLAAEVGQGRSLDLAYVMVGVSSTTVTEVPRVRLEGRCDGATHFVFDASMGAFAMETSEAGQARTAGDILGVGDVSAEASSERSSRTTDGDVGACDSASSRDKDAVSGCAALLRVSLLTISEDPTAPEELQSAAQSGGRSADARACPDGFDYDDGQDICVAPAVDQTPALCALDDASGCKSACEAGSDGSCGRYADFWLEDFSSSSAYDFIQAEELVSELEPLYPRFAAACENAEASACSIAGLVANSRRAIEPGLNAARVTSMFEAGCEGGETMSCAMVGAIYGEGFYVPDGYEDVTAELPDDLDMTWVVWMDSTPLGETLGAACRRGNSFACIDVAAIFMDNGPLTRVASWEEREEYGRLGLERACTGGFPDACAVLSVAHMGQSECESEMPEIYPALTPPVAAAAGSDVCAALAPESTALDELVRWGVIGCDLGSMAACDVVTQFAPI